MSVSVLIIVSCIVGIFSLFSIGSNGVANTQANAVGSGALSLRAAQILAGICEFCGAALVGHHVSNTVGDEIVNDHHVNDYQYCWGMFSALTSAGSWILLCSFLKMPASSTHSIVGSLIGFHLVISQFDFYDLNFQLLASIAIAWVLTPFMSASLSFILLKLLDFFWPKYSDPNAETSGFELSDTKHAQDTMNHSNSMKSKQSAPLLSYTDINKAKTSISPIKFGIVFGILCTILVLFIMVAGPKEITVHDKYPFWVFAVIAIGTLIFTASVAIGTEECYRKIYIKRYCQPYIVKEYTEIPMEVSNDTDTFEREDKSIFDSDAYFRLYLVIASGAVAFAHGGNDIANVLGPFGQIWLYEINGDLEGDLSVPVYISAVGGIFIAIGFVLFGRNVLETVGEKITDLTYRTGFAAQFASALTVLLCNVMGLPVSSSTVIVGGVAGVSFYNNSKIPKKKKKSVDIDVDDGNICTKCIKKVKKMNLKLLGKILFTWIVTVPANGFICAAIYSLINKAFL